MAIVNNAKLEAVANYIGEMEMYGNCVCYNFNDSLKENRIDVPCDVGDCEDYCPFYSTANFVKWIKEPDRKVEVEDLKKPHQEDFTKYVNCNDALFDRDSYINALEEYCDNLEDVLADTEYDAECIECEIRILNDKLEKIRGILDVSH